MFNTFINIVFLTFPSYEVSDPNMIINLLCCSFNNAFINTSTSMSSIEEYSNVTLPFSIRSWTKWCYPLMCFVRACWVGFFINDIAPWLSHRITIAFFSFMYPNSFMNFVIHLVSLVACVLAMYLASIINKSIMGCPLLFQEMAPPPIMNTNPMVDILFSRSSAQFTSQYPTKS